MASTQRTIKIPDTKLAAEAHDILREYATDILYNHSNRVYFFAAEEGRRQGLRFDPELLYVSAAFHDLGLLREYSSASERFEVDSANAAKAFLISHGIPNEAAQTVWEAIALHTTPGVTPYMKPEVSLFYTGIGLDVVGIGFDQFSAELREEIVAEYPRENFNGEIAAAFFGGFAHKPASTWATVMAGVCERFIPDYRSPNHCDIIARSPFPNSASAKK